MEISALAACCRSRWNACLGSDRASDEPGRPIAIGRSCIAQRRSSDRRASQGGARSSLVIASREPAKQKVDQCDNLPDNVATGKPLRVRNPDARDGVCTSDVVMVKPAEDRV
jgi:hypothetical protein